MKSVADELRREQQAREAALTETERLALALRLGDEALRRPCEARGFTASEARAWLRRNRQAGRRRCSCFDEPVE